MVFLQAQTRTRLYRPKFRAAVQDQTGELILASLHERSACQPGNPDRLGAQMQCDLRFYLAENILPKVDAMSMSGSLEARVPFLDNEVIDLALSIPSSLKVRRGVRKWILRQAFAARLPQEILQRGKEGFSMPMKNWLNNEWNPLMHELLSAANLARDGFFDGRHVEQLMRQHEARTHNHSHLLWALMVFQLWRDRFASAGARREMALDVA
jgi:asparagine synthase (glutamine-hydrolysing)